MDVPAGAGGTAVAGSAADGATYEPFSPSAYRVVASTTVAVPERGTYYVAVFDQRRGGRYGHRDRLAGVVHSDGVAHHAAGLRLDLLVGRSSRSGSCTPRRRSSWRSASCCSRGGHGAARALDPPGWTAALAGLLFLATGATTAWQMVVALARSGPDALAVATVFLAALAVAVGVVTLGLALRRSGAWTVGSRALLALLGLAAIVVWAGWLAGPALALVAAVLPFVAAAIRLSSLNGAGRCDRVTP